MLKGRRWSSSPVIVMSVVVVVVLVVDGKGAALVRPSKGGWLKKACQVGEAVVVALMNGRLVTHEDVPVGRHHHGGRCEHDKLMLRGVGRRG